MSAVCRDIEHTVLAGTPCTGDIVTCLQYKLLRSHSTADYEY